MASFYDRVVAVGSYDVRTGTSTGAQRPKKRKDPTIHYILHTIYVVFRARVVGLPAGSTAGATPAS